MSASVDPEQLGRPDLDPNVKIALTWIFNTLIFGLYLLRLWIQRHRERSLAKIIADVLSWLAWVFSAGGSIGITYEYLKLDEWDTTYPQIPNEHPYMKVAVHKLHFLYTISYFVIIWGIKASFIAMYFDIFPTHQIQKRSLRWTMYAVAIFTGITFVAMIMAHMLYCRPMRTNWSAGPNNCQPFRSRIMLLASYASNVSSDLLILLLPISVIRRLRLRRSHYFGVAFLLMIVFLTIASASFRFVFLWKAFSSKEKKVKTFDESIREVHRIMTWTQVETWLTMLIFALPPLRVYLRAKHTKRSQNSSQKRAGTPNPSQSLTQCSCGSGKGGSRGSQGGGRSRGCSRRGSTIIDKVLGRESFRVGGSVGSVGSKTVREPGDGNAWKNSDEEDTKVISECRACAYEIEEMELGVMERRPNTSERGDDDMTELRVLEGV